MDVKNTEAWKAAEWEYAEIYALQMVPLFGDDLSRDEIIERLESIVKECPKFYPAVLELALRKLAAGGKSLQKRRIERGLRLMLELAAPDHLDEEIDAFLSNLEDRWRFDLSRRWLEFLIERRPDNASLHDELAHASVRVGDVDAALFHVSKAIEMAPTNSHFRSNHGWIHLIAGNLKEAGDSLAEALRLAPDDEVVKGNLEVHQYLTKHGGNYFDYLVRPVDREEMNRLEDDEEWEEVERLCALYNDCRMEAMAQTFFLEDERKLSRLPDLLATLRQFFNFVRKVDQDGQVLNEDISFIQENFKQIMHKFIFKFKDVDREMIKEIYDSLLEYYGFLARRGLVSAKTFKGFQKDILALKNELIDKTERYNAIRHDDEMDEEEKESIRYELFEGDHEWPFL